MVAYNIGEEEQCLTSFSFCFIIQKAKERQGTSAKLWWRRMSYMLTTLSQKREVDSIIRDTIDKVLVLCFGRESDPNCLHLDQIVCFPFVSFFNLSCFIFRILYYSQFKFQTLYFLFVLLIQLSKAAREVSKFATVALVDVDSPDIQVYLKYFDITLIPSTLFFFNAHHMKMDSGYDIVTSFVFLLLFIASCSDFMFNYFQLVL